MKVIYQHFMVGVSVKLINIGCDVCMAKAERIFNHFKQPWLKVVGFYELQNK